MAHLIVTPAGTRRLLSMSSCSSVTSLLSAWQDGTAGNIVMVLFSTEEEANLMMSQTAGSLVVRLRFPEQ